MDENPVVEIYEMRNQGRDETKINSQKSSNFNLNIPTLKWASDVAHTHTHTQNSDFDAKHSKAFLGQRA